MIPLLDSNRMRQLDRYAIETVGLPGALLMETAGRGVFAHLMERHGDRARAGRTAVVCGRGGNGGDGFVVARCLRNAGCEVEAFLDGKAGDVAGDARLHLAAYVKSGGSLVECSERQADRAGKRIASADLIVDALFGVGLSREPAGTAARWIAWMGRTRAPVVSVDIPSGVSSDDGRVQGSAVRADLTVTFGHLKKGHFLHPGRWLAGEVVVVDIGIPPSAVNAEKPDLWLLEAKDFRGTFLRAADSHKGTYGHLGVIAGSPGKMGAAALVAWAALRSGAGLATAAYPAGSASEGRFPPEVMTLPLPWAERWEPSLAKNISPLLARCDALAVGPGLGTDDDAAKFLDRLLAAKNLPPLVLDADALTLLAARKKIGPAASRCILTPHPGEAARLLGSDTAAVQADREGALREIAKRYGAAVILKGAGTLVGAPKTPTRLTARGNPGMATAGAGDVLAGIAGAFLARGLPPLAAAEAAAFLHALAGDLAACEAGQESLTASDILAALPDAFRELEGE